MMKQKHLPILLAILILLSLLCGCQSAALDSSPTTGTPTIPTTAKPTAAPTTMPTTVPRPTRHDPLAIPSDITQAHIEVLYAWTGIEQSADTQLCFFGTFDDTYAVLVRDNANPGDPCWETVNGLTFYYPDGYSIILEDDEIGGTRGHLWQNFTRQLITEEQLQEIYDNYYSAYPELLYVANGQFEFGSEEMEAISQALLPLTGEELGWDSVNSTGRPRLVYYCSLMGVHVVRWIPEFHSAIYPFKHLSVGPYTFEHPENMQLYVYVGEELLTLAEAYDRGTFTDKELEVIHRYHVSADIT